MGKEDTPFKVLDEIYYNICNNQKTKITLVSQNIFQNKDLIQKFFKYQDDQIDIYNKEYDLFDVLVIYYNDFIYDDNYNNDEDTQVDYFQALKVIFKRKKENKRNDDYKILTWNYNLDEYDDEEDDEDEENYYLMFIYNKKNKEINFFSSIKNDYEEYKNVLIYINNNLDYIMNEFYLKYI